MKIADTSSSANVSSDLSDTGTIAKLQKRLQVLMKQLRNVATENLSPKEKQEKSRLLQAEIEVIQAQIAAIQRKQMQANEIKNAAAPLASQTQATPHTKKDRLNAGFKVDTYI